MKNDKKFEVMECLRSAIQRDSGTAECITRGQYTNPQFVQIKIECLARIDLAQSVLLALETGDLANLKTFTLHS